MNPFEYMEMYVLDEIRSAAPFVTALVESDVRAICKSDERPAFRQIMLRDKSTWSRRATALIDTLRTNADERDCCVSLIESALSDNDSRVRGTAWIIISLMWSKSHPPLIADLLSEKIIAMWYAGSRTNQSKRVRTVARRWLRVLEHAVRIETGIVTACITAGITSCASALEGRLYTYDDLIADAVRCLEDEDSRRRAAAVLVLGRHTSVPNSVFERIKTFAVDDPDSKVRENAVTALGTLFQDTRDNTVCAALARIVADQREASNIRARAYVSLCQVNGEPALNRPLVQAGGDLLKVFENIDWEYIAKNMW